MCLFIDTRAIDAGKYSVDETHDKYLQAARLRQI